MSTFYHSTRSNGELLTSKQAIRQGIAADGGLYVSDAVFDSGLDLAELCQADYAAQAKLVLGRLLSDYSAQELEQSIAAAYATFDTDEVTPLSALGNDWLLELYHGPTCAFKDVALQMLPQLMTRASAADAPGVLIVTATSGDTGKAALDGFADVPGTGCVVFYPDGKVSDVQRLQMVTQAGNNVAVCAVRGNFDDAQSAVKRIFADAQLAERLAGNSVELSSANSINVGRLAPQVVYYFAAYASLVRRGAISLGDQVEFCVPTGNFGDVLAGYYAKRMGLPVAKLIVASNANDVLVDFIETGVYDRNRPFMKTISPSMDILISSNLERLLYYASDGDCDLVAGLMAQLAETGRYQVPEELHARIRESFCAGRATDDETLAAIAACFQEMGVLIDPHTAVAKHVSDRIPCTAAARIILSTASPYKFPADCLAALGQDTSGMDGFACMDALAELSHTQAPAQLRALDTAPELHCDVCDIDQMTGFVEAAAARIFAR